MRQQAAERRQSIARGERVPMHRDERNPGDQPPKEFSARLSGRNRRSHSTRMMNALSPAPRAQDICGVLILGFRFASPEALRCRLLRRLVECFIYSRFTIY